MNILKVELTADEAKSIINQFKAQIDTLSVCNADTLEKGTEIMVETELVDYYAIVRFDSEHSEVEQLDCPVLVERSVRCKIQAVNKSGSEIEYSVDPERYYNEFLKRFCTRQKIEIFEEIEKAYSV